MNRTAWVWIPNGLTISRFALGVALPWAPVHWQFWILLFAGFTDLIDGWLSRILGATSGFGQFFDPIADKALVLGAVITALGSGWIEWYELLALAGRDLTVVILSAIALGYGLGNWRRITPRLLGKLTTAAQVLALLTLFWLREPAPWIVWSAAAVSLLSAADYTWSAIRAARS